jgi:uncharacterized membrane protein (DUF2068 family)
MDSMGSSRAMAGPREGETRPRLTRGFLAIIVFKYLKLAAFVIAGVVVLQAARPVNHSLPARLAAFLEAHPDRERVQRLSESLSRSAPAKIDAVGAASILVGLIFGTEGTLLALRVWWATYFTITLTALGLPLELLEISRHPGNPRLYVLLAINVAILAYVWSKRNEFRPRPG